MYVCVYDPFTVCLSMCVVPTLPAVWLRWSLIFIYLFIYLFFGIHYCLWEHACSMQDIIYVKYSDPPLAWLCSQWGCMPVWRRLPPMCLVCWIYLHNCPGPIEGRTWTLRGGLEYGVCGGWAALASVKSWAHVQRRRAWILRHPPSLQTLHHCSELPSRKTPWSLGLCWNPGGEKACPSHYCTSPPSYLTCPWAGCWHSGCAGWVHWCC